MYTLKLAPKVEYLIWGFQNYSKITSVFYVESSIDLNLAFDINVPPFRRSPLKHSYSGTMFNFALVFPDKRGNYHFKEVGTTSVAHNGPDDRVTLSAVRYTVYLYCSTITGHTYF